MIEMMLADEFFPAIRNGNKTSTVRRGRRHVPNGPLRFNSPRTTANVKVEVTGTRRTTLDQLTDEDAVRDGFTNRDGLVDVLTGIYGELSPTEPVTIIEFRRT